MNPTSHSARITQPVPYQTASGRKGNIPVGPCLVEQVDKHLVDIIWGPRGQSSAKLAVEQIKAAADDGRLVLLD